MTNAANQNDAPTQNPWLRKVLPVVGIGAGAVTLWMLMNAGQRSQGPAAPESVAVAAAVSDPATATPKEANAPSPPTTPTEANDAVIDAPVPDAALPQEAEETGRPTQTDEKIATDESSATVTVIGGRRNGAPAPKRASTSTNPPETHDPEPGKTAKPEPIPASQAEPAAAPPPDTGKYSTQCLLDPSAPGCAAAKRREQGPATNLDATLADKLTATQIRTGLAATKTKAKACGPQFGIESGVTVRVKVSIDGDTGTVISAEPLAPYDSQPVGKCVAQALSAATFPRFSSAQQGTTYPVTF